jgi:hypothetical protein
VWLGSFIEQEDKTLPAIPEMLTVFHTCLKIQILRFNQNLWGVVVFFFLIKISYLK